MPELQPFRRGTPGEGGPPHDQALCGRCRLLGRNCSGVRDDFSTMMGHPSLGEGPPNNGVDDDEDPYDWEEEHQDEMDKDPDHRY